MKRKTIGVCITGYDWECESRVIYGMYRRCMELDINILVFSNVIRKPDLNTDITLPDDIIHGELEIFNLINYDLLDGIAVFGDSILNDEVLLKVVKKAETHGIPIVNINDERHDICTNVRLSDKFAMEAVVRHLVDDHGLTKINFISGFKDNIQSEERISAYKKILSEHGIPIEENRIGYGEFWKKAYDCTEKFLSQDELPEAIVCANDAMAIFCMDCLKDHGYKIPDDIIVTGFDAMSDSGIYSPSVTTVMRAFQQSGVAAVDLILDIINGKNAPHNLYVDSVLVKNQSCGCVPMKTEAEKSFLDLRYGELHRYKEFNRYILDLNTGFASSKSSKELFSSLKKGEEFFSLKNLYICICSDVEKTDHGFDLDNNICSSVSKEMVSMYKFSRGTELGARFPSADLLPVDFLNGEKAVFYAFTPLYFTNRFLGYIAYEPSAIEGAGDLFASWVTLISNNAGSFYMNKELETVANELKNLYLRDPLTGLYNRRGMKRLGYEAIENAKQNGKWITVICADVDSLKAINDRYGHEAGDVAITGVAKAIESSVPKDSVCTRTGGDEYCVIMPHSRSDDIEKYVVSVEKYLDEYNKDSGLPYSIGCSCGYYTVDASELFSLDAIMKSADENMYKEKKRKKAMRR